MDPDVGISTNVLNTKRLSFSVLYIDIYIYIYIERERERERERDR